MSKSRRLLAMALSATMGLTMLAGCNNNGGNSTTSGGGNSGAGDTTSNGGTTSMSGDASKGKVYWLNFKPEADKTLQELAKTYKDKTGIEVKVVTAAAGSYNETLTAEMDKSDKPTIFNIGNALGVKDWKDWALDLKGTAIANELNYDTYNLYDDTGKLCSIPYSLESYGIVVNKKLVQDAGYNVDEIKSFAKLKEVAENIHSRASELGFDAFASIDMDDSSSWRVTGHLVNLEFFYEQKDNHWTECPATITGDYVDKFKNLYDLCINNSISAPTELATGGHDPVNAEFIGGKAAFVLTGSWDAAAIKDAGIDATMIPYYCGVDGEEKAGLNSGTENCWAINCKASADDQAASMDFMVWCVTDPDASAKLVKEFGLMPYKSAATSDNAFLLAADKYVSDGCYPMNWATNFEPNVDEYRKVFVGALNAYNANPSDTTWEAVKTAIVAGWATQYQAIQD